MSKVYDQIQAKVCGMLEKGIVPWHQCYAECVKPVSHGTGKPYQGINRMLLMRGGQYWTWKQVQDEGLKVRKGCHAEQIYFWGKCTRVREVNIDGEDLIEMGGVKMFLRCYSVFHESDVEGAPQTRPEIDPNKNDGIIQKPDEVVKAYFERTGIPFREMECVPHYGHNDMLGLEEIAIPPKCMFDTLDDYYHTLFHEMVHSTGAPSRLNRQKGGRFGSNEYAKEELVAEMGASQLAAETGLDMSSLDNSASYCANWLDKLKNDIKWFVWAASRADRAVDFILDRHDDEVAESA